MTGKPESEGGGRDLKRSLTAMSFLGVGLSFMVEVGALGFLGYWLDGRWGTSPWLLSAGVALGMTVALTHLLRSAERFEKQSHETKDG